MLRHGTCLMAALVAVAGCTPTESPESPELSVSPTGPAKAEQEWNPHPAAEPVDVEALPFLYSDLLEQARDVADQWVGPVEWDEAVTYPVTGVCAVGVAVAGPIGRPLSEVDLDGLVADVDEVIELHGYPEMEHFSTTGGEFVGVASAPESRFVLRLQTRVQLAVEVPLALEQCEQAEPTVFP